MSSSDDGSETPGPTPEVGPLEVRLEVVVVPVSDVDRARQFYEIVLGPSMTYSCAYWPPAIQRRSNCSIW